MQISAVFICMEPLSPTSCGPSPPQAPRAKNIFYIEQQKVTNLFHRMAATAQNAGLLHTDEDEIVSAEWQKKLCGRRVVCQDFQRWEESKREGGVRSKLFAYFQFFFFSA